MHEVWQHPQLSMRWRWTEVGSPAGPIAAAAARRHRWECRAHRTAAPGWRDLTRGVDPVWARPFGNAEDHADFDGHVSSAEARAADRLAPVAAGLDARKQDIEANTSAARPRHSENDRAGCVTTSARSTRAARRSVYRRRLTRGCRLPARHMLFSGGCCVWPAACQPRRLPERRLLRGLLLALLIDQVAARGADRGTAGPRLHSPVIAPTATRRRRVRRAAEGGLLALVHVGAAADNEGRGQGWPQPRGACRRIPSSSCVTAHSALARGRPRRRSGTTCRRRCLRHVRVRLHPLTKPAATCETRRARVGRADKRSAAGTEVSKWRTRRRGTVAKADRGRVVLCEVGVLHILTSFAGGAARGTGRRQAAARAPGRPTASPKDQENRSHAASRMFRYP